MHVLARVVHPRQGPAEPEHPGPVAAGEGCGYAGGILSAAVDGIKVAEAVAASLAEGR